MDLYINEQLGNQLLAKECDKILNGDNVDKSIEFDVQIYGKGGGVMKAFRETAKPGETALEFANRKLIEFSVDPNVGTVGVWAYDRKSGHAQARRQ